MTVKITQPPINIREELLKKGPRPGESIDGVTIGMQDPKPARFTDIYANNIGRKNILINGNFDIWQRGTSQTTTGFGSVDRVRLAAIGSTCTLSRQEFTPGQTDVPGEPRYFMRNVVSSVSGASNAVNNQLKIEDVRTLAGQIATVSFWAKADAKKYLAVDYFQDFGSGGSAAVTGIGSKKVALTTLWQKFTMTTLIPSIAGKTISSGSTQLTLRFWYDAGTDYDADTQSLGHQSGTFDIAQAQIEAGSVATPFEYRSYGEELTLCQRYYYSHAKGQYHAIGNSFSESDGSQHLFISFPTAMRVSPTMVQSSVVGGFRYYGYGIGSGNFDGFTGIVDASANGTRLYFASAETASENFYVKTNHADAFLAFDAELP